MKCYLTGRDSHMKRAIVTTCILVFLTFFGICGQNKAAQEIVYYTANDYYNMESEGSLHILPCFRTYQQTTDYSCGPIVALMVLEHYGIDGYDEMQIGELIGTNPSTGTSFEGLQDFLAGFGFRLDCHADTEPLFSDMKECEEYLIQAIDLNAPVIVEWVDWYGHWQVIIGIDTCGTKSLFDDVLIMADPFDITDHCQDGYYVVPFARFFCMWRQSPFADTEIPYEQPFITVYDITG